MKAIRKIDGKQIEVEPVYNMGELTEYFRGEGGVYSPSDLDFLPEKETAVIEGWVARDDDGDLYFYEKEPVRDEEDRDFVGQSGPLWLLSSALDFPSVTYESSPKKVALTLKLIEE